MCYKHHVMKMVKQHLDKIDEIVKPVDDMINKLTTFDAD